MEDDGFQESTDIVEAATPQTELSTMTDEQMTELLAQEAKDIQAEGDSGNVIPRIQLIQAMTTERGEAENGDIVHSVTKDIMAKEGQELEVVVLKHFIEWLQYDENQKLEWRTTDPNDPRVLALGEDAYMVRSLQFIVLVKDNNDPMMLGFSSTSTPAGRNLSTLVKATARAPRKFKIGTEIKTKDKKKWHVLTSCSGDPMTKEEIINVWLPARQAVKDWLPDSTELKA